jgi:Flp pilus assembly CpaF family ATPase
MLNRLTAAVPARERVITCEKIFELLDACPDVTRLPGIGTYGTLGRSADVAA